MGREPAKRVLVVEDDEAIREVLTEVLEESGYVVDFAVNGQQALDSLRTEKPRPGIILLDLMMPVMDGFAFCEQKNLDAALRSIPVVIMSAAGQFEAKIAETRAAGHLRKPMSIESVLDVVGKFCQ